MKTKLLGLLPLVAGLALLAAPTRRDPFEEMALRCAREGFVDVRDFGACDEIEIVINGKKVSEEEKIRNAEEFARTCIPGRVLPVHYCPGKPTS